MSAMTTVLGQMSGPGYERMNWDDGWSWGMVILMIVLAAVVVGAVVWAIVYASRHTAVPPQQVVAAPTSAPGASVSPSPREVLDLRYARGEIDTAEYEERRSKLE